MTNIFVISDKTYLGDRSNLLGIAEELKDSKPDSEIQEFSLEDLSKADSLIESERDRAIVISAGKYGIEAIGRLKNSHNNKILAVHLFHQIIKEENISHDTLIGKADIIALPSHALNPNFEDKIKNSKTKLVKTIGVAHNSQKQDLIKAYEEYKEHLPKSDKYLGIILPGDAPDSNGGMKYYIPQMAANLAKQVASMAKKGNFAILITNGPRTGKHNPENGGILVNHQDGITDDVTLKFVEILESVGSKYKLFDFQKGQKNHKNLIFGAILNHKGSTILAPGESTSMISECVDLMEPGSVIIYMNEAMNENHKKHVSSEFENNRAHIMEDGIVKKATISDQKSPSAKTVVSKTILEELIK